MNADPAIVIHSDVQAALEEGRPVVALESAVITHGLPRQPAPHIRTELAEWDPDQPVNLQVALQMQRAVRQAGAVPATTAILGGKLHIGVSDAQLHKLASDGSAEKASSATIAGILSRGATAGATVSATLIACRRATAPIRTFATGGIGGVHVRWTDRPDISADLLELSRTQVCVVSSGAKSILDLSATVEALETLGIPVVGMKTRRFAGFYVREIDELPLTEWATNAGAITGLCCAHWFDLQQRSGVLVVNPVPEQHAIARSELKEALQAAERDAAERGVTGSARTPHLLETVAQRTRGRSLIANVALLLNNGRVAAEIAAAFSRRAEGGSSPAGGRKS